MRNKHIILNKYWRKYLESSKGVDLLADRAQQEKVFSAKRNLIVSNIDIIQAKAELLYIKAIIDYFNEDAQISWEKGIIKSTYRTPIPFGELGIEYEE